MGDASTQAASDTPRVSVSLRHGLLLGLIGVAGALLLLEVAVRGLLWLKTSPPAWSDRPRFYFRPKEAASMQGNVYSEHKPQGTSRIAVVGDSISFGPLIQYDDTFSARLQRMLNVDRAGAYDVLNFGVPGNSTWHEVVVADQALAHESNLLLLQITLNDAELEPLNLKHAKNHGRYGAYHPEGWKASVFRYWRSARWIAENLHNARTRSNYKEYFFELFKDPQGRAKFLESLDTIGRKTSEKNVRLAAVIFPLFGFPVDARYPFTALHTQLHEWPNERGVPWLDLSDAYRNIPSERLQVAPGADLHPNEIAHRIAAEAIYRFLVKRQMLAADFTLPKLYTCRNAVREASVSGAFPWGAARKARHDCLE